MQKSGRVVTLFFLFFFFFYRSLFFFFPRMIVGVLFCFLGLAIGGWDIIIAWAGVAVGDRWMSGVKGTCEAEI